MTLSERREPGSVNVAFENFDQRQQNHMGNLLLNACDYRCERCLEPSAVRCSGISRIAKRQLRPRRLGRPRCGPAGRGRDLQRNEGHACRNAQEFGIDLDDF